VVEWANEALQGLGKGSPFSLCLTQKHFSRVASAHGKEDSELSTVSFEFLSFFYFFIFLVVFFFLFLSGMTLSSNVYSCFWLLPAKRCDEN
jgi:hypothetical protein